MWINRHVFVPDVERVLGGSAIFKLPQRPRGIVYVTDAFVAAVNTGKLSGFSFERV